MPSPFNGKWKAVEASGVRELVEAINTPEANRVKLLALAEELKKDPEFLIEEIHVDEARGTVRRQIHVKGHPGRDSGEVKFGVEHDSHARDDRPVKVKIVHENEHRIVRHEQGEGFSVVVTFDVVGDHLHATAVGNGATSVLKFVRV